VPRAPQRLLIATTNAGKLREARLILTGSPVHPGTFRPSDRRAFGRSDRQIEIATLSLWPDLASPEETGSTFEENARLKAMYYARATGLATVAEDSGLAIDVLDGAPGIHSARFGGESASYPERFAILRSMMRERGVETSTARFICALALVRDGRVEFEARGTVEGAIAPEARGENGFGYDPIFFYPPWNCTLAEVADDRKAEVSHRGEAFRKLRAYLGS
jgi:XTP/dITP diphosphohydrolase